MSAPFPAALVLDNSRLPALRSRRHYGIRELDRTELPSGMFGENFTTGGVIEAAVNIGDRFRIGTAELIVTQPRLPCYKLQIKLGRDDMIKRFLASGRTGFYFSVAREGEVGAGDEIALIGRDKIEITVPDIARLYLSKHFSPAEINLARRATQVEALPESWRTYLFERLQQLDRSSSNSPRAPEV